MATPTYDFAATIGLPGWTLDGRHVRLADVMAADPDHAVHRLEDYRRVLVLLKLAVHKVQDEIAEAEDALDGGR